MGLIDSHAHLTFPELRDRLDEILTRCDDGGIDRIITLGIDLAGGGVCAFVVAPDDLCFVVGPGAVSHVLPCIKRTSL